MEYSDADPAGVSLPQAVCWESLKYDILGRVDIPCRIEFAGHRLKASVVRARLSTVSSDEDGYFHTVQMYLHRIIPLGAFGSRFRVYCQADGKDATLLQLRVDSDRAFQSEGMTRFLAWGYGLQWQFVRAFDEGSADESQDFLSKIRVSFGDVPVYDFGQLTQDGLNDGFHRRGYAYLANLLRAELAKSVR